MILQHIICVLYCIITTPSRLLPSLFIPLLPSSTYIYTYIYNFYIYRENIIQSDICVSIGAINENMSNFILFEEIYNACVLYYF